MRIELTPCPRRSAGFLVGSALLFTHGPLLAQERDLSNPPVAIALKEAFDIPPADARTEAVVAAADAFLAALSDEQRAIALFPLDDAVQRANWSNFPDGPFRRAGVARGDMSDDQLGLLDALLSAVLSESGLANVRYQMRADDVSAERDGGDYPNFGADFYFVSFLGEPAPDAPFAVQFGGHHLAINALFFGADASFSPMLTGGEPLRIEYEGAPVTIAVEENVAATALLDSLDADRRAAAIRGEEAIDLVLGPGEYGTTIAPEGVRGADLTDAQRALLEDVIASRLGYVNPDDFAALMEEARADLEDTYFGWWGPEEPLGAAYWRVTGPSLVIEYAPQAMDGDPTDHAHNMYRDPTNDYGAAWLEAR